MGTWADERARQAALDRLLDEFAREFGPLPREALIVLGRLVDEYADFVRQMETVYW